jgi:hypothetical protein
MYMKTKQTDVPCLKQDKCFKILVLQLNNLKYALRSTTSDYSDDKLRLSVVYKSLKHLTTPAASDESHLDTQQSAYRPLSITYFGLTHPQIHQQFVKVSQLHLNTSTVLLNFRNMLLPGKVM